MSRRGRRPILNDRKKAEILAILSTGCDRRTAANYVGCDPKTIYNTVQKDREFADQLFNRQSVAELAHLANINRAGRQPCYWRTSAWHLERLNPGKYVRRSPDTITPQQLNQILTGMMEALVEEVPVARFRKRIIARMNKMLADIAAYDWSKRLVGKNSDGKPVFLSRDTLLLTDETPENAEIDEENTREKITDNRSTINQRIETPECGKE
jgi:hypothetical protein